MFVEAKRVHVETLGKIDSPSVGEAGIARVPIKLGGSVKTAEPPKGHKKERVLSKLLTVWRGAEGGEVVRMKSEQSGDIMGWTKNSENGESQQRILSNQGGVGKFTPRIVLTRVKTA